MASSNTSKTAHVMNLLSKNRGGSPAQEPAEPQAEETAAPQPAPAEPAAPVAPIISSLNADAAVSSQIKDALEAELASAPPAPAAPAPQAPQEEPPAPQVPEDGLRRLHPAPVPAELPGQRPGGRVAPAAEQGQIQQGGVPVPPLQEALRRLGGEDDGLVRRVDKNAGHGSASFLL